MRALGEDVADVLRPGDVVVLDGPLGAGKTTFTQGIGRALAVRGQVTSPTFVIARMHPGPGPALVHVDAYRLGSAVEVDDLDLDADLAAAVTVVEWGVGKVEGLAPDRLEVLISRAVGAPVDEDDPSGGLRSVVVQGIGPRWAGLVLGDQ
jgi:tRNA threonylcarbamoyladenosine biosynthesis protein TsaE